MTAQPQPVSLWENESVKGMALVAESDFEEGVSKARKLRKRQAEYLKSLPFERDEAIRLALKYMEHDHGDYPEGIEEALHLSAMLVEALRASKVSGYEWEPEAAIYVADRIEMAMRKATIALDRAHDLLRNPARVEREALDLELPDP